MIEKTSDYYFDAAKYWLMVMLADVKNRDKDHLKVHYQNLGDALSIAKIARKRGD